MFPWIVDVQNSNQTKDKLQDFNNFWLKLQQRPDAVFRQETFINFPVPQLGTRTPSCSFPQLTSWLYQVFSTILCHYCIVSNLAISILTTLWRNITPIISGYPNHFKGNTKKDISSLLLSISLFYDPFGSSTVLSTGNQSIDDNSDLITITESLGIQETKI